jgi:O-antigen/teichoic acid export membrane protein
MASLKAVGSNIDILVLAAFRPSNEVEIFNQARSAANLMTLLTTPVVTVIYPLMNEAWAKQNLERVRQLVQRFTLYASAIAGSALIFWFLFADVVVSILYKPEMAPTAGLIRVVAIGMAIETVAGWVRSAAMSNGKPGLVTFTGFAALMAHLVLALPLAYYDGATGVAVAYIAGVLVSVGLNMTYVLPRLGLWNPLGFLRPQPSEAK